MLFAILGEECNFSLKLEAFRDLQIKHTNFLECFVDAPLENFNAIQIQNQALHRIAKCDERESNTSEFKMRQWYYLHYLGKNATSL